VLKTTYSRTQDPVFGSRSRRVDVTNEIDHNFEFSTFATRRIGSRLIARVVVQTRMILITVAVVLVIIAGGTVVQTGIARIAIGFALVGRVLIPTVLAKDIHGLVDSIGVLFLVQGILGWQGS